MWKTIVPIVTIGLSETRAKEPIQPKLAKHKSRAGCVTTRRKASNPDRCAACGQPYIDDFVTLMDGAIVHYDGMYGDRCFRLYQEQRRA